MTSADLVAAIAHLKTTLGAQAHASTAVLDRHGHGESNHPPAAPDTGCCVRSTADVVEILRTSQRFGVPVVPFGAGSSLEGHVHAIHGGISIDMRQMNRVLRISAEDLDATVEAGVPRLQLAKALGNTGLMFPV